MLALALLGLPVYICASGATPVVAVFLAGGVSPGAVLAFLLTGPATNISTFGVVKQVHGSKAAYLLSASTLIASVGLGLLVNCFYKDFSPITLSPESHSPSSLQQLCLAAMGVLLIWSILRRGTRSLVKEIIYPVHFH